MMTMSRSQTPIPELAKSAVVVAATSAKTPQRTPFDKAYDYFHETRRKVNTLATAERLWERILTAPQRRSLGNSLMEALQIHRNTVGMWKHIHQVSDQRAVIDIGEKVGFLSSSDVDWLLREGGDLPRSPEDAMDEAIHRGDLVIVRASRTVYWKGDRVEADWVKNNVSWNFLNIACELALQNKPIDRYSFGEHAAENVVTKKKSRLMRQIPHFPLELYDAFVSAGRGTQRFNVPANRIHFFDNE